MPIIAQEVVETVEAVTRPIVFAVARDVLARTGISMDASIYLNKGDNAARSLNTGVREEKTDAQFSIGERIKISMEEEFLGDGMLDRTVPHTDFARCFHDKELDIWIRPMYHNTRIILSVEMDFLSESAANNWTNGIRRKMGNGQQHQRHTGEYHFAIPIEMMSILGDLWKTREKRAGYGDTFAEYLKGNFSDLITVMTNQAGSGSNFAISEKQTGFNGWYDFDRPPQARQDTQQFTATFTYTFEYQKPTAFTMGYPLMVHNNLIPSGIRLRGENFNELVDPGHASLTKTRYDRLMNGPIIPGQSIGGVSIPEWDEWLPRRVRTYYSTLIRMMLVVEEDNPRAIVNLDSLGVLQLDPIIRAYMAKDHAVLSKSYEHPITIVLYRNGLPLSEDAISVDENLFVTATFDLNPRHCYHLWIGCVTDLSMLSDGAVRSLIEDGETTKQIIRVVDSGYDVDAIKILDDGTISLRRWNDIKTELRESMKHYRNSYENNTLTVGQFTVTAQNLGRT
jgi:hypothetical protein